MKSLWFILGALFMVCLVGCNSSLVEDNDTRSETQVNEVVDNQLDEEADNKDTEDKDTKNEDIGNNEKDEDDEDSPESIKVPYEPGEGIITELGALKVIDSQLSASDGNPVQLKGLSSHGLQWFGSFISENSIQKFSDEWEIDILRAALYVTEDGYVSDYKNYALMGVHKSIELATKNGIYVMVDWHVHQDKDPMIYMDEAKEFFTMIGEMYGDHDNIIYEICNEPNGNITWEDNIKPYAEEIIPLIRSYNEDAVIIVGTPSWSQEVDKAALNPLEFDNLLYTLHFYAGTHGQELRDTAQFALDNGIGLFVTEWGTSRSTGSGGVFIEESDEWMAFLDENKISWCNWSIADKAESSALFLPNIDPDGVWPEDRISESGHYVRNQLLKDSE